MLLRLRSRAPRGFSRPGNRRFVVFAPCRNAQSNDLPFNQRRHSETFGQIVRSDRLKKDDQLESDSGRVFDRDTPYITSSPFRDAEGVLLKGKNAKEARLHDLTLLGRVDQNVTKLPYEIAKTINNEILALTAPDRLREKAALLYQALGKDQIQKAPETGLEADAHIAALFLQDYAHARQVLLEIQKRSENFHPLKVLDVGYGPAVGMVALNEIMGDDYSPVETESYIIGRRNSEMKKRAKIILSRQVSEQKDTEETETEMTEKIEESEIETEAERVTKAETEVGSEMETETETESETESEFETELGSIDTSAIRIRTKLRDTLPLAKQYDLIIVNRALLTREYSFPRDIDINIHSILRLLSPGGHLALIERGNALGFETIARARQVMLRPESYQAEHGKIPRPYIKGSSVKPQKLRNEDQMISDEDIEFEKRMLRELEKENEEEEHEENEESEGLEDELVSDFEKQIIAEHGQATNEELKFEFEDNDDFELIEETFQDPKAAMDYHISIIAPCSHHRKCPLQLGDPKYYKIPSHKHRFNFCSFSKTIERPKFTMELKRGKRLATAWDKTAEDGFGLGNISKKTLRDLEGSGRPGGNNTEVGNYSYLVAQRSRNDEETIKRIDQERRSKEANLSKLTDIGSWPRIIENPKKVKNNVKINVCAPSGNIETWQVPKSLGKQEFHDARKAERGDSWGLGKKSVIVKSSISEDAKKKLDVLARTQRKSALKEERKKQWKKLVSSSEDDFETKVDHLADELATAVESSKKYKLQGKRAKFDVDPRKYDGK
ncbi:37S ribosomal protein S22 [Meyerozyma guilliermondii]